MALADGSGSHWLCDRLRQSGEYRPPQAVPLPWDDNPHWTARYGPPTDAR